ncbi:MAG TPA: DUF1697 domain-containing protein [Rhizomicrobium sp.]|nr:DUF1697 domain-containing protein [Rhizomicrobium sp.]
MTRYVAFLRAVNVGGTGKVAMAELKALAEEIGLAEPRTLLQSGNLVFASKSSSTAALEKLLEREVAARFGVKPDVVVRSAKEIDAVIARNPFAKEAKNDPGRLHVHFLKSPASAAQVAALNAAIKGREVVKGAGAEVFIYFPDGAGNSKLTGAVVERHLGARGTARNWNTVTKLAEMT